MIEVNEYQIFSQDVVNFIVHTLKEHGCYKEDQDGNIIACPFWSWDEKNENGQFGECIQKHSDKFCVWLSLLKDSKDLKLVIRSRTEEDSIYEKEDNERKLLFNIQNIKKRKNVLDVEEKNLTKQYQEIRDKKGEDNA